MAHPVHVTFLEVSIGKMVDRQQAYTGQTSACMVCSEKMEGEGDDSNE